MQSITKFFCIEPEVAGGLGKNTVMDRNVHPPVVDKLHYQFDGWLGDVLLESFPCFVVTEHAKQALNEAKFTGIAFDEVEITTSEQFTEFYPTRTLPRFAWLKVLGRIREEDFGLTSDGRLVASERAVRLLSVLGNSNALVTEYAG